jgi:hypothetical protein
MLYQLSYVRVTAIVAPGSRAVRRRARAAASEEGDSDDD